LTKLKNSDIIQSGGVESMPKGKVKWFNENKGYGLIMKEDGSDVFVHYSDIEGEGFKTLSEGDRLEFEIVQNSKGSKAINVVKL
jgi:CspA family cold shock protein